MAINVTKCGSQIFYDFQQIGAAIFRWLEVVDFEKTKRYHFSLEKMTLTFQFRRQVK